MSESDWVEWRLTVADLRAALDGRQDNAIVVIELAPNPDVVRLLTAGIQLLYAAGIAPDQSDTSAIFKLIPRQPGASV